jgi:hypothetical protein
MNCCEYATGSNDPWNLEEPWDVVEDGEDDDASNTYLGLAVGADRRRPEMWQSDENGGCIQQYY